MSDTARRWAGLRSAVRKSHEPGPQGSERGLDPDSRASGAIRLRAPRGRSGFNGAVYRSVRSLLLAAPLLLLVAGWLALGRGAADGPGEGRVAEDPVEQSAEEDVALVQVARTGPGEPTPALERAPTEDRRPASDQPVKAPAAVAPSPLVMGVVIDGRGTPLPGVVVKLSVTEPGPFPEILYIGQVRSDHTGGFCFQGSDRRKGGRLTFGEGYLVSGTITQEVVKDAPSQVLQIPSGPAHDSTWTIEVLDTAERPLLVEAARLTFIGGASTGVSHVPDSSERLLQFGLVEQRGLPPGRWRMTLSTAVSLEADVEVEILEPRSELRSELLLETVEGGIAEDVQPTLDSDGQPWIDPASGLREILPEDLLAIGEDNRDHHFAQTFRVGAGDLRAAQLILDLEANSGMSHNDSIYLQHLGAREYAWGNRLTSLTGGRWSAGMRRRVLVDLSRLPSREGGTVDLRSHLASGRLDLVIQDDTVVHAARLRILRGE